MRRFCPNLPGDLIECDSGMPSDYEGLVIPLADLTSTSVFWMPNEKDPHIKARAFEHFVTELGKQIWQSVRETANTAKEGDGAKIWVHWVAEAEVKPLPEEML